MTKSDDKRGGGGQGPDDKRMTRGGVGVKILKTWMTSFLDGPLLRRTNVDVDTDKSLKKISASTINQHPITRIHME